MKSAILLIYHHPYAQNAPTIMEHVRSFARYSCFKVWSVNTAYGFPSGLEELKFRVIVLHFGMFGSFPFSLPERFRKYIERSGGSLKVAFFQDEHQYCTERFALINRLGLDHIYSLFEPEHFEPVYYKNTSVKSVLQTLTGYVDDILLDKAKAFGKPRDTRTIDVGYRARQLPYFMGRGAQEKANIALEFANRCRDRGLVLDITPNDTDRLYGDNWYRFVGNCRFVLGVEAGVSITDLDGSVRRKADAYLADHPAAKFDEVEKNVLLGYEGNINYRTISPRMFEAAAFRTGMVLFRGHYNGILKPDEHYIPLEKDFSNFEEVLQRMRDDAFVEPMVERTYADLIASGVFHYYRFIQGFDNDVQKVTGPLSLAQIEALEITKALEQGRWIRSFLVEMRQLRHRQFPGRDLLKRTAYRLGYKGG